MYKRQEFKRSVLDGKNAPLKIVRDKLAAHIDKETILGAEAVWKHVDLLLFLDVTDTCMRELDVLLKLDVYSWTKNTKNPDLIRLMSCDGTLVDIERRNGELGDLRAISLVRTPKLGIANEGRQLVSVLKQIRENIGTLPPRPR